MNPHHLSRRLKRWLSGKTVRYKLGFITTLAVSCAALTASASLLVYRIFEQRANYEAETLALTQIVAENATGSVSFQDTSSAESVLATLRATPSIRGAAIDIPTRQNFAVYGKPPGIGQRLHGSHSAAYNGWWLLTAATIGDDQSPLGTVNLISDLRPMLWAATRASFAARAGSRAQRGVVAQSFCPPASPWRHPRSGGKSPHRHATGDGKRRFFPTRGSDQPR